MIVILKHVVRTEFDIYVYMANIYANRRLIWIQHFFVEQL
jgi:hypothetical protein